MMRRRWPVGLIIAVAALVGFGPLSSWAADVLVTQALGDDPYVLLVLGSDAGPPRSGSASEGRADGFHLVVLSPDRTEVAVVSIPRDSWVHIPGVGNGKINAALVHGPDTAVAAAEAVTGLEVDDWVLTGFRGITEGVEALGGITVNVERRLNDPSGAHSDLQPGRQVLDGDESLAYLRDRKSRPDGDLDRSAAHGRFLKSAHRQLSQSVSSLSDLVEMLTVLQQNAVTSLSTSELLALGHLAMTIQPENIRLLPAPVRLGSVGAASVVFLTSGADAIFRDLRDGVHDG